MQPGAQHLLWFVLAINLYGTIAAIMIILCSKLVSLYAVSNLSWFDGHNQTEMVFYRHHAEFSKSIRLDRLSWS